MATVGVAKIVQYVFGVIAVGVIAAVGLDWYF